MATDRKLDTGFADPSSADSRVAELQQEQQKALRAFYDLFGRLGLTMICEATLEQCLVSGINEIDALQATEGRVAELERELSLWKEAN